MSTKLQDELGFALKHDGKEWLVIEEGTDDRCATITEQVLWKALIEALATPVAPTEWTDAKLRGIASDYFPDRAHWPAAMLCLRHLLMEQSKFGATVAPVDHDEFSLFRNDLCDFLRHVIDMGKGDHYWDVVRGNAGALLRRVARIAPAVAPVAPAGDKPATSEPVAWQWRRKGEPWSREQTWTHEVFATTDDSEVRALYTAPPDVPPGWVLVPAEPTKAMMKAFQDQMHREFGMHTTAGYHHRVYDAMLAASPKAPT